MLQMVSFINLIVPEMSVYQFDWIVEIQKRLGAENLLLQHQLLHLLHHKSEMKFHQLFGHKIVFFLELILSSLRPTSLTIHGHDCIIFHIDNVYINS